MPRIFLLIACCSALFTASAQCLYTPDEYGYVSDPKFHELIKEREYQLVGAFLEKENRGVKITASRVLKNGHWIYINCQGTEFRSENDLFASVSAEVDRSHNEVIEVIEPGYDQGSYKAKIVSKGNKVGYYIGEKEILPIQFSAIENVRAISTYLLVTQKNKQGLYSENGKLLIPVQYDEVLVIKKQSHPYFLFQAYDKKSNEISVFDMTGKMQLSGIKGDGLIEMIDDKLIVYAARKDTTHKGLMDYQGKRLTEPVFTNIDFLSKNALYQVTGSQANKKGILNKYAELVLDTAYTSLIQVGEGFIRFIDISGNSGLFDMRSEKVTIPCLYKFEMDAYDRIRSRYIVVSKGNDEQQKFGLFDITGKELLPVIYSGLREAMNDTTYIAAMNGKYGLLDIHQRQLMPFQFEWFNYMPTHNAKGERQCADSLFVFREGENMGVMDINARIIIPPLYREVAPLNGFWVYETGSQTGLLDPSGKLIRWLPGEVLQRVSKGVVETYSSVESAAFLSDLYGNSQKK